MIHAPAIMVTAQPCRNQRIKASIGALTDLFPQRLHIVCDLLWRLPKLAVPLPTTCRSRPGQIKNLAVLSSKQHHTKTPSTRAQDQKSTAKAPQDCHEIPTEATTSSKEEALRQRTRASTCAREHHAHGGGSSSISDHASIPQTARQICTASSSVPSPTASTITLCLQPVVYPA